MPEQNEDNNFGRKLVFFKDNLQSPIVSPVFIDPIFRVFLLILKLERVAEQGGGSVDQRTDDHIIQIFFFTLFRRFDPLFYFLVVGTGLKEQIFEGCIRVGEKKQSDEKETLWDATERIEGYLCEKLLLNVKKGSLCLAPVMQGLPFLGFRVFPGIIRISRKGWRRFRRKIQLCDSRLSKGKIDYEKWTRSMASLVGHLKQSDTRNLRASFFQRPGAEEALTG